MFLSKSISVPKRQIDSNNCKECEIAISNLVFSVMGKPKVWNLDYRHYSCKSTSSINRFFVKVKQFAFEQFFAKKKLFLKGCGNAFCKTSETLLSSPERIF